jgi:hypothetical protein
MIAFDSTLFVLISATYILPIKDAIPMRIL